MIREPLIQAPTEEKSWIMEEKSFDPEYLGKYEALFAQGNGYLGQRAALDEHYWGERRNLFVSGTFDRFHENEVSELPNLPDVTNISLRVGGRRFTMLSGRLVKYSRKLNLLTGELIRKIRWVSPEGAELEIGWSRIASMKNVHFIASRMTVTAVRPVELVITSGIDGTQTNTGTQHTVEGNARVYDRTILEYSCRTENSQVQAVTHVRHRMTLNDQALDVPMKIITSRRYLGGEYALRLEPQMTLAFEKVARIGTSRDWEYRNLTDAEAGKKVLADSLDDFRANGRLRYADVLEESAGCWKQFWKVHDVKIESADPLDQMGIRFAIYHLNSMTNRRDSRIGVAAKGLSGEGYKGHSFWDTEIFILPFFLFTQPETAKSLLEYRYMNLPAAKKLAQSRGYHGAMYPWESGWIEDGDLTPDNLGVDPVTGKLLPCLTGKLEQHITADIAFAVEQYYNATRDQEFMERCGNEILLETAQFWASRVEWSETNLRYEIHDVIGPDEYQIRVNNNAYTNYLAFRNMELGLWALGKLEEVPRRYEGLGEILRDRLEKLYLPQPEPESGIVPQFDGYLQRKRLDLTPYRGTDFAGQIMEDFNFELLGEYQAAKQADVIQLMILMEELFDEAVCRKNYLYYEPRTLHDSSLSKAVHSMMASDLGMTEAAYEMFRGAAQTDLGPQPHSSDDGIHSANMGGMWQAVVMGFGGLRATDGRLRINPHLPSAWKRLQYQICWQGSRLAVRVTSDAVRIKNDGDYICVDTIHGPMELPTGREVLFHCQSGSEYQQEKPC